jgi:hypothetical protein
VTFDDVTIASRNVKLDYDGSGAAQVTISGYVRTSGGTGVAGVVMSGLPGNPTTAADGSYSATVGSGWSGAVTPQKAGYTFSPPSRSYSNVTSGLSNEDYTGQAAPQIATLGPGSGPPGTQGIITGTDFGAAPGSATYTPDGGSPVNCGVLSWSATQVAFRIPGGAQAGSGQLRVVRSDAAQSNPAAFQVTAPTTAHVDASNTTGLENGTTTYPFDTVQEGINAAGSGSSVKVARGTYHESLLIDGKRVDIIGGYVGGTYPGTGDFGEAGRNGDPATNNTMIDGSGASTAVECQGAAARGSSLSSFAIRNGGAIFRGGLVLQRVISSRN